MIVFGGVCEYFTFRIQMNARRSQIALVRNYRCHFSCDIQQSCVFNSIFTTI
jgi:hypothetical protein